MAKLTIKRSTDAACTPALTGEAADSTAAPDTSVPTPPPSTTLPGTPVEPVGAPGTPDTPADTAAPVSEAPREPKQRTVSSYRRRRSIITLVVLAGVGLWLYRTNQPAQTTGAYDTASAGSTSAATPPGSASSEIQTALAEASAWQSSHSSFDGFAPTPAPGLRVGAAGPGVVVSVQSGSSCLYSGVLPSGVKPVLQDSTGQACTDTLVAQAKATLASQGAASGSDNSATLATTAAQAASTLGTWSRAANPGQPSFAGLPSDIGIPGVVIQNSTPTQATVKITSGTSCGIEVVSVNTTATPALSGC